VVAKEMKMTITGITGSMKSLHEGHADPVAYSVPFSLVRPLTTEGNMQIYNITERGL
jgi:hypothetical protein